MPMKQTPAIRDTLSKAFEERFASLNEGQKRAVETIEGPVMVVAGPGTGKTEVVGMRVAHILKKTHARPGNILCLTFSVSAATEMRERLRGLIGSDAYGVTVRNFHGFCADLIAEHPLVFDAWSAMEPISDVERYRQVNKIIDQLLPDLQLVNRKSPYARTPEIIARISALKREGVTERGQLLAVADAYEADLLGRSKDGTKAHEKNVLTARKFRDFLEVYFRYQEMLLATQRYDYDDMILFCIRALEEEDWLLAGLQERYQYVLVDEFQDTNGAQYHLVELLTTPRTPEDKPNLFVVGDDDQAIYRFQGANLTNILRFHARFPSAPVIPLTVSYRCTSRILDAAGSLIGRNTERLTERIEGLDKHLTSGAADPAGPVPALLFAASDTVEPWMVADIVAERLQKKIPPEEIAVLCQTNAEVLKLNAVFTAREIPVEVTGKADLLQHPLVRQAVTVLRAVESPSTNAAFSGALSCACFGVHPADLARLNGRARDEKSSLLAVALSLDDPAATVPLLVRREALLHARDVILDLHNKLQSRTVVDTLEHLLKESGLLASPEKGNFAPADFAALQEFFERLKTRAYEQSSFSFEQFLDDLLFYENPEYGELKMGYSLPHLSEKGVKIMTAHQSKGQEFTTVILFNFREGHWDKRHHPSSLSIPEDLLFGWQKEQKAYERGQDERRVCFVAMTRAKRELLFTCPRELTTGDKARSVSPSGFFAEAGSLPEEEKTLKDPLCTSTLLLNPVPDLDREMRAFLLSRLEEYALSVTALNHFLEDPKKFLESDILQMPQAKQVSLVYGNAVHDALKKWGMAVQKGDPLTQEAFLSAFRAYLDEREILTDSERRGLLKVGEESLPRYFASRLSGPPPIVHKVEYAVTARLEGSRDDSVPIKGKIDRIDLLLPTSSDAIILDYKTGHPLTEKQIRDDGGYFRQLVFYALLLKHSHSLLTPREFVLDFVGEGSDHPVTRSFVIADAEIADLQKIVEAVWAKVMKLDFTPL
ncbi:MAG: ATP-dependent DNA helicase [Candidatus Peribacteraceae bacterium]|nr:ATP-dependent DNA helicase [Candidatus Peribacteraceae bacterium]MDD5743062.1 ATP-dependent DNA helicase [Candidatus Peribacteraceae bacterium]